VGRTFQNNLSKKKKKKNLKLLNTVLGERGSIIRGFSRFEAVFEPTSGEKREMSALIFVLLYHLQPYLPRTSSLSRRANIL